MHPEKTRLILQWMTKADRDLITAQRSIDETPAFYDIVVFHCQQAAEKALKGYLAWQDQPLQRTHDLEVLVGQCVLLDEAFVGLLPAAERLTPYASEVRYPEDVPDPSPDEATEAIRFARQVLEFVSTRLPEETQPTEISENGYTL